MMSREITCFGCGKNKVKPNYKSSATGLEFCSTECFGDWYKRTNKQEKIDLGLFVGRPSLLKDRWEEFESAILNERLRPEVLASRFGLTKPTALYNKKRVLEEHDINIHKYNKEVNRANPRPPKPHKPKMPKEFYVENYNVGYWDFENNKWFKGATKAKLARMAGIAEQTVGKDLLHYGIKKHREDIPAGLDIKGRKFDLLKPVRLVSINEEKIGHNRYVWECKCDCGEVCVKSTTALVNRKHIKIKNSCGCENKKFARWADLEINTRHFNRMKSGAKKRGLEFDITPEFVDQLYKKQEKKSAISGKDIVMPGTTGRGSSGLAQRPSDNKDNIASLDRIDSSKGYTMDNVWWISRRENICKMDLSIEDVERFFKDGYEYLRKSRKIRKAITQGVF
jgi:hypothetical protein